MLGKPRTIEEVLRAVVPNMPVAVVGLVIAAVECFLGCPVGIVCLAAAGAAASTAADSIVAKFRLDPDM